MKRDILPPRRPIFARRIPSSLYPRTERGRAALAHTLYWLGDKVNRWSDSDWRFTATGFDLYQWLMAESVRVQGDGRGPWQRASAMSTGTAKTPQAVEGRSPASAVAKPDAQEQSA